MTCEVVVANMLGIALAADSAVTFRDGSSDSATYSSGANKIFQLTASEPVAVMVYSSANLNRVPWEVVLKSYRRELGPDTFAELKGYGDDLIDFINNRTPKLLPQEVRDAGTKAATQEATVHVFKQLLASRAQLADTSADLATLKLLWADAVQEFQAGLSALSVDPALDAADLAALLQSTIATDVSAQVPPFLAENVAHLVPVVDGDELVRLGLQTLFCRPQAALSSYTGVVVAGYGAEEFLPGFLDCHVYGFVGQKVYWRMSQAVAVNHTNKASLIEPFARKSMIETFTQGASPEVWKAVRDAFVKHANEVCKSAAANAAVSVDPAHIDAAIASELDPFTQSWAYSVFGAHLTPLRSVISGLNVEELAELAETLVMLESLKEKVTSRTQGVGGPIDVAVITKSEGLVWIKRKHYFNPELNQRYFLRLQRGV